MLTKKLKLPDLLGFFLIVGTVASLLSLLLFLSGCHKAAPHPTINPGTGEWRNYRCAAVNLHTGNQSIGWSTDRDHALYNAMGKCQDHAQGPEVCKLLGCTAE